ncbi:hypothetical protein NliqN6_6649 [Naganishia liquefaciens]|uniref:DUF676 domain-containing protein n=1 Tax=Naganishia liquefaciens TaxID=104408 RepID=A0A8H3TZX8_9TREE|nr:hypothetical protein NliqN6_6649 [Naganishia liquefaciens]
MPESLLIVYVHGFKGTDVTFEQFPDRLRHVVQESLAALDSGEKVFVESKVFPVFETKGELQAATDRFVEWLTGETVALESATQSRAKVVLCGHSMGGLLIADAAIGIKRSSSNSSSVPASADPNSHPMWPRVIALIAFDTPYLGLHPFVFKNGLTKYAGHVEMARNVVGGLGIGGALGGLFNSSTNGKPPTETKSKEPARNSTSQKNAPETTPPPDTTSPAWSLPSLKTIASAALITTASAAAYYRRQDFLGGYQWIVEHAVWLKNLWDSRGMKERLDGVGELASGTEGVDRIVFRNYYTLIPASANHPQPRTFCILPASTHPLSPCWRPSQSTVPEDEVAAHIGMFNPVTNEAFYEIGLDVCASVLEAVAFARGRDGA